MTAIGRDFSILHERSREFPAHFSAAPLPPLTWNDEEANAAKCLSRPSKLPLFRLTVSGRTFHPSKPIGIQVTQDGNWFFAENEALNVVGMGQSYEEAVLDLEYHIVHFWQYYRSLQDSQVTGDAARLKALFSNLLAEAA